MQGLDRKTILGALHELSMAERLEIVREVLSDIQSEEGARLAGALRELSALDVWLNTMPAVARGRASAASLRGIARMDNPPDDTTVERWLDEHRMEKYGS
jgi:hypothetical protein